MRWQPIALSGKARKTADRVGGVELILPWPPGLSDGTRCAPLGEDEERDATREEHAAAEQIVGPACAAAGLVPVRSAVAMLRRPPGRSMPDADTVALHLIVLLIGRRWVHASTHRRPPQTWYDGRIVRV